MAKDPATTRIPRLDGGISRIPPPGSFSGSMITTSSNSSNTTSHIRPPTATASALKATTQIFRTPALPGSNGNSNSNSNRATTMQRPISSYHPAAAPLHDLDANIKKSASGERLNNAVNLISKRTTTVLKRYFGQSKLISSSNVGGGGGGGPAGGGGGGVGGGGGAGVATGQMMSSNGSNCSSLPQTPLPASKRQLTQQQQLQLTSSTPMQLMRSETFVCDEEDALQQQRKTSACLENTRLSNVGFGCTPSNPNAASVHRTRPIIPEVKDATQIATPLSSMRKAHERTRTVMAKSEVDGLSQDKTILVTQPNESERFVRDKTRLVIPASELECLARNRTRPVITTNSESDSSPNDATQILNGCKLDRTKSLDPECLPNDATQILKSLKDSTRTILPPNEATGNSNDATHIVTTLSASGRDRTRPIIANNERNTTLTSSDLKQPAVNLTQTLDVTKSMDRLPLLEHMSMPSGLDLVSTKPDLELGTTLNDSELDVTLTALAPDKGNMTLPLNSTINTERLLDITGLQSPARHIQLLNLTREFLEQSSPRLLNTNGGRRSMVQQSLISLTPQSATTTPHGARFQHTPVPVHLLSPLLKAARSDLVLPTRTPDGEVNLANPLDATLTGIQLLSRTPRTRYSFGLDLPDSTLDNSIELVDNSFSTSQQQLQLLQQQLLKKQHSFDLDDSLGILTPDQMKEFLDSPSQHNNNNSGNLSHHLELQLAAAAAQQQHQQHLQQQHHQLQLQHQQQQQQLRLEQTPSPEELPLDPIEPQLTAAIAAPLAQPAPMAATQPSAKLSNSFITSVTSVTSLDTGYQGDGEMSRPASRGACDHSPSNGPQLGRVSRQPSFPPLPAVAPLRRQDPMTDSDFFTESDADDVLQRGDRRAQVIDGQLYGPDMLQPSASVPQLEDSCMESSGIFTDVENRCDEEMRLPELEPDMDIVMEADVYLDADVDVDVDADVDMSPDESTQTMRKQNQDHAQLKVHQQRPLSSSSAATLSLSNRTSYCSIDGATAKSFCDEAFNASAGSSSSGSSGSGSGSEEPPPRSSALSVQRGTSPRPHASLTSLCTVENLSTSSSLASPKSCKPTAATATKSNKATPTKATNSKLGKGSIVRKTHTPNKWDAVMHKIASNKSTIKTNYNDVKSKVSTKRDMAGAATTAAAGTGSGSGSGSASGSTSSNASPRISPNARRSPSITPINSKRGSSSSSCNVKPIATTPSSSPSPSPSASASMRQPQDKGSVGAGAGVSVFARLSKSQSPTSPTSATAATAASAAKRLQPLLIKRGRSYSKDNSQKSSHSDLSSLSNGNGGGGSPKLLAKTPLRAAKKRDVRNLSISPTDLGPPPKTQQTAKGQSTRNKSTTPTPTPTAIQKRINNNAAASSTTIATNSSSGKITTKSIGQPISQQKQQPKGAKNVLTIKNCTKPLAAVSITKESLRSGVDQTELQELNNLGLIISTAVPTTPRDSKRASISKELLCICGAKRGCNCAAEKAPKVKRQELIDSTESTNGGQELNASTAIKTKPGQQQIGEKQKQQSTDQTNLQNEELQISNSSITMIPHMVDSRILIQNPILQIYMHNGCLNFERLARNLEDNGQQVKQIENQVLGLSVVIQFMTDQIGVLSCKEKNAKTSLKDTLSMLEESQCRCDELRKQLHDKEQEWSRRHEEREQLRRIELQQAHEVHMFAEERMRDLEAQLLAKDEEKEQSLQAYHQEVSLQLRRKQDQLHVAEQQVQQLQTRVQDQEVKVQQMREKLTSKENTHAQRLSSATHREEELQARLKALTKELQTLRTTSEHNKRDLSDRLILCQDEISVLRISAQRCSPNISLNDSNAAEMSRLNSEADSLRCVLELKQSEISTLSKQNNVLKREIEEQRNLSSRISLLEAQNEMLQTELDAKTEKEKDIQRQLDEFQKAHDVEIIRSKRLTCDKEQLVYQLQQRTEQLNNVQHQLHDVTHGSLDRSSSTSCNRSNSMQNTTNTSPPASPVIKAVIERNDSVSWVLEIDDESPQLAASRVVRRCGSLRSNSDKSLTQRRQLNHSMSVISTPSNGTAHHQSNGHAKTHRPNPLSQSMSAKALARGTQSNEAETPPRSLCRLRSNSTCGTELPRPKQQQRPRPNGPSGDLTQTAAEELPLSDWNIEAINASSPQSGSQQPPADVRVRSSAVKLMSCDAYPKALKKFQEIQESAGEAMVSGANSEDESCSASSEDMRSSSASSTASAAGCSLSKRQKQPSRMSIEEALMLEQAHSLNGTPMEVSWSEDAADADVAESHSFA